MPLQESQNLYTKEPSTELVLTEQEPLIIFNKQSCLWGVSGKWDMQKDQMDIVANLLIHEQPAGRVFSHKNLFGFGSTGFN